MSKAEQAVAEFLSGFNCAESIVATYAQANGLDKGTALKLACGLGAGMGRMAHVCGAVSGAFIIIGLHYGRTLPSDNQAKEKVFGLVRKFTDEFKKQKGSIICKDLMGCDLSTPDGFKYAGDHNLARTICPELVRTAATILEPLLEKGAKS
jgi:C_GCAxxG_C_C family probable redox protein